MNIHSKAMNGTGTAMLLAGLLWAHGAVGQEIAAGDIPAPDVDRASCADVNWHRDLLGKYPWVADACHEVIVIDGQKWARFEADFQRMNRDGSITSDFKNRQGRSRGNIALMPGPDQRVSLDGRPYRFSELQRGQTLNFYVPEGMYAFSVAPGAPREQLVNVVETPAEAAPRPAPAQLARAEPRQTETAYRLPSTAGPLPLIALGGTLSLLAGLGLGLRRRFRSRSD
ncbi:MAG TPA: hypothetical protein PKZ76_02915 [Xanthomonadaceae bacterium]|nr:hypothetical protein [Xanthomonadaceae bacterium]